MNNTFFHRVVNEFQKADPMGTLIADIRFRILNHELTRSEEEQQGMTHDNFVFKNRKKTYRHGNTIALAIVEDLHLPSV